MNHSTDTHNEDRMQKNSRHHENRDEEARSPKQLEREVDQARARLEQTASELSNRLSPGELIEQALDMAREHGGEFSRNLGAQVKNNPMPMILSSLGLTWMMMSSGKTGAAHGTHETNSDKTSELGDRVHEAGTDVKHSVQHAGETLAKFYREQPLIAGSLGIAIGAALGGLVPPTEMEDEVLGEASDRSVDAAKSTAVKEYDELRDSARPH